MASTRAVNADDAVRVYDVVVTARKLLGKVREEQKTWAFAFKNFVFQCLNLPLLFVLLPLMMLSILGQITEVYCLRSNSNSVTSSKRLFGCIVGLFQCLLLSIFRDTNKFFSDNMQALQDEADKLTISKSTMAYVIPAEWFRSETAKGFVKFEHALERGLLREIPITEIKGNGAGLSDCQFISHKWDGANPDGPNGEVFEKLKKSKSVIRGSVWLDYMCCPQDDRKQQETMLFAIPDIMARCEVRPFYVDGNNKKSYVNSVWCQLEVMGAINSPDIITSSKRQWTICNKDDLYFVLPGFLAMTFSQRFRAKFLLEVKRVDILLGILNLFLAHHREQFGVTAPASERIGEQQVGHGIEDSLA